MKQGDKFTIRLYERPLSKDADTKFLMCPDCGLNNGITVKVGADTVLYHFPPDFKDRGMRIAYELLMVEMSVRENNRERQARMVRVSLLSGAKGWDFPFISCGNRIKIDKKSFDERFGCTELKEK